MVTEPYEIPSEALIASIKHEAEKLGYLVAKVETMFSDRAKFDRHKVTVNHTEESIQSLAAWMNGTLNDAQYAAYTADSAEVTSQNYDHIKMSFEVNMNRLKQIVSDAVEAGKSTESELDRTLDQILGDE